MITYTFPPIAFAGTYRTLRFCRSLPENGWLPVVVTIKRGEDLNNDDGFPDMIPADIAVHRTRTVDFWRWWQQRERKPNETNGDYHIRTITESGTLMPNKREE